MPVPAASLRANLNVCYHPEMDLTAAELPLAGSGSDLSLILILPGKQAEFVAGGLGRLEDKINLGRGFMFNAVLTPYETCCTHTHTHTYCDCRSYLSHRIVDSFIISALN